MFLVPSSSRTRCWPWLERKELLLPRGTLIQWLAIVRFENNKCRSTVSFKLCKYSNRKYITWTNLRNVFTYGHNSTSKYLSSAPRKNISATKRQLTIIYYHCYYWPLSVHSHYCMNIKTDHTKLSWNYVQGSSLCLSHTKHFPWKCNLFLSNLWDVLPCPGVRGYSMHFWVSLCCWLFGTLILAPWSCSAAFKTRQKNTHPTLVK